MELSDGSYLKCLVFKNLNFLLLNSTIQYLENPWGDNVKADSKPMRESDRANFISSFQTIKTELCWFIEVCYTVICNLSNSSFTTLPIQKQFKKI